MTRTRPFLLAFGLVAALALPASALPQLGPGAGGAVAPVDAGVAAAVGTTSAIVHGTPDTGAAGVADAIADLGLGLVAGRSWDAIDATLVFGTASAFRALAADPRVVYVEENAELDYFHDSSQVVTRSAELHAGEVTLPDGTPIDGRGIGIAIVDTGLEGLHPDFEGRVGVNLRFVCAGVAGTPPVSIPGRGMSECQGESIPVPMPDSDTAGGHGTHVAGSAAGDGAASDGRFRGAAPGATIYGLGIGTGMAVENALDGLAWILDHHDQVDPPIRVMNNSWGGGHQKADEDSPTIGALTRLQNQIIDAGVVSVFAAGNAGGDGSSATTSGQCVNRTLGNICVASADDQNRGDRDRAQVSSFSSRGDATDPETWPSIMAPGSNITSTCRVWLPICMSGADTRTETLNSYGTISGTSMASPHISGIAAQILQVDPDLTPAEVQLLLQATAFKLQRGAAYEPDPFGPEAGTSSFDKGHGMVDVVAAVELLLDPEVEIPGPAAADPESD